MQFYVVDNDFKPFSDGMDSLEEATEYATQDVIAHRTDRAIVVGMESAIYSRSVPAYICLTVSAGSDLERLP